MTVAASQFNSVLIIGAGEGDDLQDWLATDAKRIILVEPNPACAPALKRAIASSDRVEHVEAAMAARDGDAQLRVFNLPRHSSLRKPSTLMDLLPGLRQVASVPVATLSAASLLNGLGLDVGSLLLMLDAPGAELEILQSFKEAGALDALCGLDLICSEEPQYQGSVGRPDVQAWVEAEGFSLAATDASDPDWPRLSFRIDHKARKIGFLTAELAEMYDAKKASEDQISTLHAQLAAAETAASTSAAESAEEIADLREQLLAADEALTTAIKDNEQTNARQTAEYCRLEAERDNLAGQLEAATAYSHDLSAQLDEMGKAVAQHLADLDA
jgi:FkbM family methyltransferase